MTANLEKIIREDMEVEFMEWELEINLDFAPIETQEIFDKFAWEFVASLVDTCTPVVDNRDFEEDAEEYLIAYYTQIEEDIDDIFADDMRDFLRGK